MSGPAQRITTEGAKQDKLFYFVVNVLVYRDDGRCLLLKRSEAEKVHPGRYATPGGKLEWSDLDLGKPSRMSGDVSDFENIVEQLAAREVREEAGIEIGSNLKYVDSLAFVRPDGIPVVLVKMAARYLGGEVKLEQGSFTGYVWASAEDSRNLPCINGIEEEIEKVLKIIQPGA